jgi:sugar/nucleoside kinase (ribokinase family)
VFGKKLLPQPFISDILHITMDIVGFGVNAIDQVIRMYRIPTADAKVVCPPEKYELFPGGVMGNTLTGLSRLGLKTGYIGKTGDDEFGRMIREYAAADGIDMKACPIEPGAHSAWTWIVVDEQGERTITLFPNVLQEIDVDFIRIYWDYIASAKLLHLEASELPLQATIEAAGIARTAGVRVSFDLDIPASDLVDSLHLCSMEELEEAISLSDYFIPCIGGARELADSEDPLEMTEELRKRYGNEIVAVSHGAEGCFVSTADESFRSPAFSIHPVDGTGSGDAFHAGVLYGIVQGMPLHRTAEFANACGALNTMVLGARSGMKSAAEVEKFIAEQTASSSMSKPL